MPWGSISLIFTKIKETGRGRHRIPPRFFFVSCATHDASACEKHVPLVSYGESGHHPTPRHFAPQGRIRPYSPEMTGEPTTLAKKNRYRREIHEIDLQCDHVISCDIDFDLQRELATRSCRGSRRCRTEARYRTISHDRTVDQPHEFLGCCDITH